MVPKGAGAVSYRNSIKTEREKERDGWMKSRKRETVCFITSPSVTPSDIDIAVGRVTQGVC